MKKKKKKITMKRNGLFSSKYTQHLSFLPMKWVKPISLKLPLHVKIRSLFSTINGHGLNPQPPPDQTQLNSIPSLYPLILTCTTLLTRINNTWHPMKAAKPTAWLWYSPNSRATPNTTILFIFFFKKNIITLLFFISHYLLFFITLFTFYYYLNKKIITK